MLYPCCEAVLDYNGRNKHKQHPPLPHQSGYDKIFWTAIGVRVYVFFNVYSQIRARGATGWEGRRSLEFHTLAKDMSLIRGATHFTLGLRLCIIYSSLLEIYLRPPLKITQLRPCNQLSLNLTFISLQQKLGLR